MFMVDPCILYTIRLLRQGLPVLSYYGDISQVYTHYIICVYLVVYNARSIRVVTAMSNVTHEILYIYVHREYASKQ